VLGKLFERVRVARLNEVYREELETKNLNLSEGISELRADQTAGRKVQMKMLPEKDRVIGDMRMTHMIQPSLYLSGDFLDYLRLDDHLSLVYIADVSGHGASSAFVTVLLKNLTNRLQRNLQRGSSEDILDPASFLKRVNHELQETGLGKHVTMFVGLIDANERVMRYAVGAHFPMPIISSGSETRFLEGSGLPVGLFADPQWETYTEPLPEGFRLILFSDGILEVINAKSLEQKEKRLLELVSSGRHTIDRLSEALQLEEMSELPDDIAIVTVTDGRAVDE
jgi:sigma-B regulation protein RsbU (phosphoserine phosphatase)